MVRASATTVIQNLFRDNILNRMIQWSTRSTRKNYGLKALIAQVRFILDNISGGDLVGMLKTILTPEETESLKESKYKDALTNLSVYFRTVHKKEQHHFIRPLKNAGIEFNEVKKLGFPIGRKLWISCADNRERAKGGHKSISNETKNSLVSFLKSKSRIASNRTYKSKISKSILPVRYLEDSKIELFKKFKQNSEISYTTFIKYCNIDGQFRKATRITDICDYCEWAKKAKVELNDYFSINNIELPANSELIVENLENRRALSSEPNTLNSIINTAENYNTVMQHKDISDAQRDAYNSQRRDLLSLRSQLLVEVDFKQKIVIGLSPRQINKEFYSQELRSCLGFGVTYVDQNEIETINFDIISNSNDKQDALSTLRGFRILRSQEFFKKIDTKNYKIWADCGKHFRNSTVMGYLFKELKMENIHVDLNFFGEKHGKNGRDTHFSCISRFIHQESLIRKLTSSSDVVEALHSMQHKSNENRIKNKLKPIKTYGYVVTEDYLQELGLIDLSVQILTVKNLESYFNFKTVGEEFILASSVLSNHEEYLPLHNLSFSEIPKINSEIIKNDTPIEDNNINEVTFNTLYKKHQRIKLGLKAIENNETDANSFRENGITQIAVYEKPPPTIEKPSFCKDNSRNKGCQENCHQPCKYSLKELNHETKPLRLVDIVQELTYHNHPSYRVMPNKKARSSIESRDELIKHYTYAHNLTK